MLKSLFLPAALAAFLVASTPPAYAAPGFIYDCDMSDVAQGNGWVSPKIAFVMAEDGTVQVVDAVTLHFTKGAVAGTILRDNGTRLIVKWTVKGARSRNGISIANFDYRASLAKRSGKIELSAGPRAFGARLRSAGTCTKRNK